MSASYVVQINPDLVPAELVPEIMGLLEDVDPILLDVVDTFLYQKDEENFMDQGETFGEPWAALSPRTVKEKARLGFPEQPEVRHGHLASALGEDVVINENSISVGIDTSAIPYAAAQNFGNPAKNLPPRILIGFTPDMATELQERLDNWAEQTLGLPPGALTFTQA